MRDALARAFPFLLPVFLSGCIVVQASGDHLFDELLDEGEFHTLTSELDAALVEPSYELSIRASPWRRDATWRARFVEAGSDREAAMASARRAVLRRVAEEHGRVLAEHDHGPFQWALDFVTDEEDDERGRAEVTWRTDEREGVRDACLEIAWEETD
jgi:hypothetical protein